MNNTSESETPKQHYALFFYPGRTLTPEQLAQREVAIAAWVKQVTDLGIWLDPRSLGETAATFSGEAASNNTAKPGTIVFFDAPTKEQALEIAKAHPGLQYGVTVEVRPWTSPRETAAKR
jgi:hypothetical protein